MTQVVKLNQLLSAVGVEAAIEVPLDGGKVLTLARPGDYLLVNEEDEFVKVVDAATFADKYVTVRS